MPLRNAAPGTRHPWVPPTPAQCRAWARRAHADHMRAIAWEARYHALASQQIARGFAALGLPTHYPEHVV